MDIMYEQSPWKDRPHGKPINLTLTNKCFIGCNPVAIVICFRPGLMKLIVEFTEVALYFSAVFLLLSYI